MSEVFRPAGADRQAPVPPGPDAGLAGHTRISTEALTSVAKYAAAQVLLAPPAQVRVHFSDDSGALALSISSAMGAPSLPDIRRNPARVEQNGGTVLARAVAAKALIMGEVQRLTGSQLSRVDIRISGLVPSSTGRVL